MFNQASCGGQERLGGPARYAGVNLVSQKGPEPVSLGSTCVPWALGLSSFFSADIMRHLGLEEKGNDSPGMFHLGAVNSDPGGHRSWRMERICEYVCVRMLCVCVRAHAPVSKQVYKHECAYM